MRPERMFQKEITYVFLTPQRLSVHKRLLTLIHNVLQINIV